MRSSSTKKPATAKKTEKTAMKSDSHFKKVRSLSNPEIEKPKKKKEKKSKSLAKTLEYYLSKLRSHSNPESDNTNVSLLFVYMIKTKK
jgi:hypothetical protein